MWFTQGDEAQKKQFVAQLLDAYQNIGFVAVKNHGIDQALINDFYSEIKAFFDLTEDEKKQYHRQDIAGQRGYTPFGKEHAKGRSEGDLKEFWHFGQYDIPEGAKYPENVIVDELPSFNTLGERLYRSFETCGIEMLRAIALGLDLDENFFDSHVRGGNSILRPIHYPPITDTPKGAIRAGEHEDINLITLLVGASADGLEVLNKQGQWIGVTAVPEHIIVNVGDMLQRLTNGVLKSTTHRVVNPPKEKWGESRYSVPFFLHPQSDMSLACLENCISEDNPKAFDDLSAGEYLDIRLSEIGLK